MALWENFSKKASETTAKALQQAKVFAETSKLNSLVSEEEKKIDNGYYQIGKLYATIHQNDAENEFVGLIAAIAEAEQRIKEYRAQIQEIKGVVRCEKCGAEVPKGVAFCSSCGSPVARVESADAGENVKCDNCGAMVKKGMRFCTSCGKPMPVAPVPQVETPAVQPDKRICPKCGATLESDLAFCTGCGTKL